ncbi:YmaF family protein [Aneurinibacillus tyrosinisolvens]|uniref:YmaF family protein n=1 Tax=Aneurinibacillus tyrosinisolvens TaxID=1443435 RepID=UPI00063F7595|nr:YmaF family protein [Aneurinibacillus tyrosinisolvens]
MEHKNYHTHNMEFIYWQNRQQVHRHNYSIMTSYSQNHAHQMHGVTSADPGDIDNHVHYYEGMTTFMDGHVHYYRGMTGPAIPLPSGGHIHEFAGRTSYNDMHTHNYHGRTGAGY